MLQRQAYQVQKYLDMMEKTYRVKKWKNQFKLQEGFLNTLQENTKPLLTFILCEVGYCFHCGSTGQHHFSCQYSTHAETALLEMVHKDYFWINVGKGYYVSDMVHLTGLITALFSVFIP